MEFHLKTRRIKSFSKLILLLGLSILLSAKPATAQLDLHGHLDIKPGVGPLISGDFFRAPVAHKWSSRLATKASMSSLSRLKKPALLVVAFYAHPLLSVFEAPHWDGASDNWTRQALELEYQHILGLTKSRPDRFAIAKNASEAQAILNAGKTAFVLSIEGADGILETEEDLKLWIDERGVAIVTPFHLTEDHLGGTALMPGLIGLADSPLDFIKSVWITGGTCLKEFCRSTMGIKPDGRLLVERLMKRKVWIDLAHSNDMEAQELLSDFEKEQLPVLVSHTELREYFPAERGLGEQEINYLKQHDGIIGLMPTQDMIKKSPIPGKGCKSGLEEFKVIVQKTIETYGAEHVALGSDINSPLNGLSPSCEPLKAHTSLEKDGFATYSQWEDLIAYVSPTKDWADQSRNHFLKLWKQVR